MRGLVMLVVITGCAAAEPEVAAPVGNSVESVTQELQICGETQALHPGDWIQLRRRVCTALNAKSSVLRCSNQDIDRGQVLRTVDARCVIVAVGGGVAVRAGDTWSPVPAPTTTAQSP